MTRALQQSEKRICEEIHKIILLRNPNILLDHIAETRIASEVQVAWKYLQEHRDKDYFIDIAFLAFYEGRTFHFEYYLNYETVLKWLRESPNSETKRLK